LNENQYYELCRLADQVLTAPDATPARISIPWLHIIREHPVFLRKYESILFTDRGNFSMIRIWLNSIRNSLSLLKILLKSLFAPDISEWLKILDRLSVQDYIFVSHLLNKNQYEKWSDPYYGDLPQKLNEDGHPSLKVLLNHTKVLSSRFNIERHSKGNISKVVFPTNSGFLNELKNLRMLFVEFKTLRKSAKSEKIKLKKKFYIEHQLRPCRPAA
jgi:hypothetical protein